MASYRIDKVTGSETSYDKVIGLNFSAVGKFQSDRILSPYAENYLPVTGPIDHQMDIAQSTVRVTNSVPRLQPCAYLAIASLTRYWLFEFFCEMSDKKN